jgi:uncharacterized membrane protein
MTGLERAYRWLLYAYPAWYRRERGDEMLDTLLAAAPHGRTWLSLRDSAALILGGLRVRAGQNRRLTTATNLRLAVLFGVALWLSERMSSDLGFAALMWLHSVPAGHSGYLLFSGLAILAAAGAAWLTPRPVAVAVALAAAAVCAYSSQSPWWLLGEPAMLVALALLALGKERMPRSWLWLFGIVIAGQILTLLIEFGLGSPSYLTSQLLNNLPLVLVGAVMLWAVVDARPAIAVGICVALGRAIPFATGWYNTSFGQEFFLPLAWGTLLALVMVLRLRRQAVL